MNREDIHREIDLARDKADIKWGERSLHLIADTNPFFALGILTEEVGEVARGLIERDIENAKAELIDVLQVATAWLEAL